MGFIQSALLELLHPIASEMRFYEIFADRLAIDACRDYRFQN